VSLEIQDFEDFEDFEDFNILRNRQKKAKI